LRVRQKQLKQISFRLYDTQRDRRINNFLESLGENQSEYLRRLVEQQMARGAEPVKKVPEISVETVKKVKTDIETKQGSKKRLSGGFKGFKV